MTFAGSFMCSNQFNWNRNRDRFVPVTIESVTICDIYDQNVTKLVLLNKLQKKKEKQIRSQIQFCDSLWPSKMSQIVHTFSVTGTNLFLFLFGNPARNGSKAQASSHQRVLVCGACTGTAQVGVLLVSLSDPLLKQSRLHCLDVSLTWHLWHKKV